MTSQARTGPDTASGTSAASPWTMPWAAWRAILLRTWREAGDDNLGLIAAGVAFYGFLALVPLLGAIVLSYGLIAEPSTVIKDMGSLTSVMPADAAKLIGEQLMNVVRTSGGKKGLGLLMAFGFALFGARNGAGSIVTALNVAYEEKETRGFVMVNLLALAITAVAVIVAILALVAIAALGHLEALFPGAPGAVLAIGKLLSYALLALAGAAGVATLYRYGPSRQTARWVWLTPGSALAALLWVALTLGFGVYVASFGNYNATYGSLGAVVVLLTWLYLSSYVLLFGAELNAEFEHQTARDTTTGAARPIGERGAWVADHVAGEDARDRDGPGELPEAKASIAPGAGPTFGPTFGDVAAGRAAARVARAEGLAPVGLIGSALASYGLAALRTQGARRRGVALLGLAAGLAWLRPARPRPSEKVRER